ncbi:hypothetical protein D3C72_1580670 [compost metagenome]
MPADGRRVKPVAHLHVDQRFFFAPAVGGALLLPDLPHSLGIALNEVGGIGFTAVGNDLQGGAVVRPRHALGKIIGDHHQPADAPGLHQLDQLLAIVADGGFDIGRTGKSVSQIACLFALLFYQDPQPQLAGIQVDAVAKNKQQHQRNDEGDQPAGRIAHNLPRLFQAQRAQPPPGETAVVGAGRFAIHAFSS